MKKILATASLALTTLLLNPITEKGHAFTISSSQNLRETNSELFDVFNGTVNTERLQVDESLLPEVQADMLRWDGLSDSIDVFFINEGAGHRNQLLFTINDGPLEMLFEDIASPDSISRSQTKTVTGTWARK